MILADYFKSQQDLTWNYALQCGVKNGVIRLPEDADFDLTDPTHWAKVYKNFTDFGITPIIIEPMPNALHDHIKAGDEKRDECIEKVIKMLPIMDSLDIRTICLNWMAHIGWLRTRSTTRSEAVPRSRPSPWRIFSPPVRRSPPGSCGTITNIF